MEAWRQWLLGGRKKLSNKKTKTYLTPTGLLMEGDRWDEKVDPRSWMALGYR